MDISKLIDHTYLKPYASFQDIEKLCNEAVENKTFSVCVAPCWARPASGLLFNKGKGEIKTCSVIGFPHGNSILTSKINEIVSLEDVADEFDIVINLGNVKSEFWWRVEEEIKIMRAVTVKPIKYIIEIGVLTPGEVKRICDILIKNRIDFVKTSTGVIDRGATVDDIKFLKEYCKGAIKIKASGGIKTFENAKALIEAGADRIGCSVSVELIKQSKIS